MEQALLHFADQFAFEPKLEHENALSSFTSFVVGGMGGSHLAAGLLKMSDPDLDLYIHRDYGLPPYSHKKLKESLFIASSHSGNTAETLDFAHAVLAAKLPLAIITSGGALLQLARDKDIPHVILPHEGLQPRAALGHSMLALALVMKKHDLISRLKALQEKISASKAQEKAAQLVPLLKNKIPVVYAARARQSLAYVWKITFNETAKIPAFFNIFSELNHNEMTGFDGIGDTNKLTKDFVFVFIEHEDDSVMIKKRMHVTRRLLEQRGNVVVCVPVGNEHYWKEVFEAVLVAGFTAVSLAEHYGVEAEAVPMIEEFKKLIA